MVCVKCRRNDLIELGVLNIEFDDTQRVLHRLNIFVKTTATYTLEFENIHLG